MTGRQADAGPGDRPHLRLVTGGEAEPAGTEIDLGDVDLGDLGLDADALELLIGGTPDGDLEFLLVPLLAEAERQMRSIRRPLDAEMWASELLGMLELGAPEESTPDERAEVTLNLATRLVAYAVDQASLSGLAIVRTLSVIGPPASRALAQEAAVRMTAAGLHDRAWVGQLGRPVIGKAWRFRDPEGSQESVTVVFGYGKREHTLTVLIDHELGGGVKDCWVGEDPAALIAETRATLASEGIEIEFIPVAEATRTLAAALTHPECPRTPDENEDLALGRALLHARVDHLLAV